MITTMHTAELYYSRLASLLLLNVKSYGHIIKYKLSKA